MVMPRSQAAHVLLRELQVSAETLSFQTRFRGLLHAQPQGDRLALDLPAVEYEPHTVEAGTRGGVGGSCGVSGPTLRGALASTL